MRKKVDYVKEIDSITKFFFKLKPRWLLYVTLPNKKQIQSYTPFQEKRVISNY